MKFATFCCLLAFCAFEIVHADKDNKDVQKKIKDFLNSNYRSSELSDFLDKKGKKTVALLNAAKEAKKNTVGCQQGYDVDYQGIYVTYMNECGECALNAQKKNNYQAAVDCCDKKYKVAVSNADVMLKEAKYCLDGL